VTLLRLPILLLLAAAVAAGQGTLRVTVVGIDCAECAPPIQKALRETPGVTKASLDWKAGDATVETGPGFDRERLRQAIGAIGYEAVFVPA
jgi:copper chaperone CopZ